VQAELVKMSHELMHSNNM